MTAPFRLTPRDLRLLEYAARRLELELPAGAVSIRLFAAVLVQHACGLTPPRRLTMADAVFVSSLRVMFPPVRGKHAATVREARAQASSLSARLLTAVSAPGA